MCNLHFVFIDLKDTPHCLCLLVYCIPKGFIPVSLPHGDSISKKPYFATWPSTMKMIKSKAVDFKRLFNQFLLKFMVLCRKLLLENFHVVKDR